MSRMQYTVTVTDWTKPRGYRDSGRGWRVRCGGLPTNDSNALSSTEFEDFYRSKGAAVKKAKELAETYKANLLLPEE